MKLAPVEREHFPAWKQLRAAVYTDLDEAFHDREMEWIFASPDKRCWLLWTDAGEPVGLLEVSLRNVVDGCVGSPVGYIEGMFITPEQRGAGHGRRVRQSRRPGVLPPQRLPRRLASRRVPQAARCEVIAAGSGNNHSPPLYSPLAA